MLEESLSLSASVIREKHAVDAHQDLTTSKAIVPCLTITVHRSLAVDADVFATPDHESDTLLERVVEVVALPIRNVIGELHVSDRSRYIVRITHLQGTIKLDIYIIEHRKIDLLANDVGLAFLEMYQSSVLCLFQSPNEIC